MVVLATIFFPFISCGFKAGSGPGSSGVIRRMGFMRKGMSVKPMPERLLINEFEGRLFKNFSDQAHVCPEWVRVPGTGI
jgi:hypothetical protein